MISSYKQKSSSALEPIPDFPNRDPGGKIERA
jgi:hypothetical protein